MDRIVRINVSGNYISKDSKTAGVRGEGNSTSLIITFDEGWDKYAKTVTFWDARGENPVERTLTTDLLENINNSTRIYKLPIPYEPMAEAGYLTFIIDGYANGEWVDGVYVDGKRKRSVSDTLEVKDTPDSRVTHDATPTQAEQLQAEIDRIKDDIQGVAKAKTAAEESAESAKNNAEKAMASVGKTSYIGDNGNWYAWDGKKGEWYDTLIKAQAGSTVYVGSDMPDADSNADVWIDPDGDLDEEIKDRVLLKDQTTEKTYILYVSDGDLRIKGSGV